jgi:glycosyltransferase involved in cell wall biosynthesis
LPYAVDNATLIPAVSKQRENRAAFRESLGFRKDDVVILFAGKLVDKKRPFDLLKAYEKITVPGKGLLFVGDGPLRQGLEAYSREKGMSGVSIVGFKNQTELPAYYAAADVFVLPSGLGETWGLVVNEAMCAGLPVVVSDLVGCSPDLVEPGENGYVYKCGDVAQLAEKLGSLIVSPEARLRMGERSLRRIGFYSYGEDVRILEGYLKSLPSGVGTESAVAEGRTA